MQRYNGILFILPAMLGIFIFLIIPILCSFGLSFFDWDLLNEITFVGLNNYISILTEQDFLKILTNTIVFSLSVTIFAVIIPLIIATILNSKIKFGELFKTIYFLPFITPAVVIAITWAWIFDPNIGLINSVFNLHAKWLFDNNLAMPIMIFITVWKLIGYNIILFMTGFSTINNDLYEASSIDGANCIQTFFNITLPLLKNNIIFVIIVTAISSFQVFDLIYVLTSGGPNDSTNVLVYSVYKYAFEYFDIGKSCALAYILFFVILFFTLLQRNFINEKD